MDSHERADRQRLWPTDQKRTCEPVNKMYCKNREATTDREKTDMFNDYFINVFQLTRSFSPDDDTSFLLKNIKQRKLKCNKVGYDDLRGLR